MAEIKAKILLVDDIQLNLDYLEELLEELEDTECVAATSGLEAIQFIEEQEFALGILDIQMPGIDGFETLIKIRESRLNANMPIIFVSGVYNEEKYIVKGIQLGAVDFMPKPFNNEVLFGKVKAFLEMYRNRKKLDYLINELEQTNEKLSISEERFRKITMVARDAIVVTDHLGTINFWNEGAVKMFGYEKEEALGENLSCLFSKEIYKKEIPARIKKIFRQEKIPSGLTDEFIASKKENEDFPVELSVSCFKSGESYNTVCIIRDISRRHKIQIELLKAKELKEANKVMKQFMDNMNHELRTPLNAIIGISKNLIKYNTDNLSPKQKESLGIINSSGNRLNNLVEKLFEFRETKRNELEEINISEFCKDMEKSTVRLIDKKNIEFKYTISPEVPEKIRSDKQKISIILNNLLDNAVKFTEKGEISIDIGVEKNNLLLKIMDTGIGMTEEEKKEVFKKFVQLDGSSTRQYSGTGLGLALVKRLVLQLKGEIIVESEAGKGTAVILKIPV